MFKGFSFLKFVNGFALWKGEALGKFLYFALIVAVSLGLYHKITQKATSIVAGPGSTINVDEGNEKSLFTEIYVGATTAEEVEGGFRVGWRF